MNHHSQVINIIFHGTPTAITVDFEVDGHDILIEGASNAAGNDIELSREEEQEAANVLYGNEADRRADAMDATLDRLRDLWAEQDRDEGRMNEACFAEEGPQD